MTERNGWVQAASPKSMKRYVALCDVCAEGVDSSLGGLGRDGLLQQDVAVPGWHTPNSRPWLDGEVGHQRRWPNAQLG